MAHSIPKHHPELVSGSVRGEEQERLAESMTIQGAKSQRPTAKLKCSFVLLSKPKTKSQQWKKEWDNQRNSFIEIARALGRCKTTPASKTKQNAFFDLLIQKWAVSHQQTAEISLSKHPILPLFQRCAKLYKSYRIDYLYIVNNILRFCVFAFLCFEF